jgi:hypothetical protein
MSCLDKRSLCLAFVHKAYVTPMQRYKQLVHSQTISLMCLLAHRWGKDDIYRLCA